MIGVRVLDEEDWALWRRMRHAALAEAPSAFSATLADWSGERDTEARWRNRLRAVPLNVVITRDEAPVGMVSALGPDDDGSVDGEVELIGLWMRPEERGRGTSAMAMRQVVWWAFRAYPTSGVRLSVKADNERAIGLYRRHGFVDVGASTANPAERRMRRPPEAG